MSDSKLSISIPGKPTQTPEGSAVPSRTPKPENGQDRHEKDAVKKATATETEAKETARQSKRLRWVDAAKGIAILAIIIGHVAPLFWDHGSITNLSYAHNICTFVYSFHVPLFFILSGYTMSKGFMRPRQVGKLFARTFIPYIVTSTLTIAYCMAVLEDQDIMEWLAAGVYGAGLYRGDLVWDEPFGAQVIGAVWFLPALFLGKLISSYTSKMPDVFRVLVTGVLFAIGETTAGVLFLPFDIQQGMCASFYMTCGMMLREHDAFDAAGARKWVLVACATIGIGYAAAETYVVMYNPVYTNSLYPNGILDALGTICASIAVIALARVMANANNPLERGLELLGRSTLPVFCFHSVMMSPAKLNQTVINDIAESGSISPDAELWLACAVFIAVPVLLSLLARVLPGFRQVYYPGKPSMLMPVMRRLLEKDSADEDDGKNTGEHGDDPDQENAKKLSIRITAEDTEKSKPPVPKLTLRPIGENVDSRPEPPKLKIDKDFSTKDFI